MSIANIVENVLGKNTSKTVKMKVEGSSSAYYVDDKEFDCVVSISQNFSNTITSNPVEFGTPVTDNIFRNSRLYELSGVVSPYSDVSILGVTVAQSGIPSLSSKNHAQEWFDGLKELSNLTFGGLITLTVYPESYPNLAIETLSFSDSYSIGEGISFKITLKEVIIATTSLSSGQTADPSDPINYDSTDTGTAQVVDFSIGDVF